MLILLTVLKIIGIILLALLSIVIILICFILFVPVRYRLQAYYRDKYELQGKISWLFHILSIRILVDSANALQIIVRVFGIPVFHNQKPDSATGRKKKVKQEKQKQRAVSPESETKPQIHTASIENEEEEQLIQPAVSSENQKSDRTVEDSRITDETSDLKNDNGHDLPFFQKIKVFFLNIIYFLKNIKYTFRKFYDTMIDIKGNITYYYNLLQQDGTKLAFEACKDKMIKIYRNIRPKEWQVNLHIGMDDPASMGEIMGIWGMLYPFHEGRISMEPDFEHQVFEGDFYCKGRITINVYLWAAFTILFDKNIKHLKKCLLREEG